MLIVIETKLFNNMIEKCLDSKFKKGTLHYHDDDSKKDKKIKVIYSNDKLFVYHPTLIYTAEIIPRQELLVKMCSFINSIKFI
jgi:hypothetical protein